MTKILLIDDETSLRNEVAEWLAMEGYEAFSAENGVVGVELAFRYHPDLIICDLAMPEMDGYRVLQTIRAETTIAQTPFIFLTAKASRNDINEGLALGADDYITKPFTHRDLFQAIKIGLQKKA